jgi:Protein of unknown function (DUF2568)
MSTTTRTTGPSASPLGASTSPLGASTRPLGGSTSPVGPGVSRVAVYANLALRFGLELASYAALGYWGASLGDVTALHVVLAIVVPAAAMAVWVTFLAPKASRPLTGPSGLALELVVFLGASAAAASSVSVTAGVVLGVVAAANGLALRALGSLR